jgi:CRP-like cAMP-binding protein
MIQSAQPGEDPRGNLILGALPAGEFAQLAPILEPISLRLGDVIYEPGAQLDYIYFPTSCVVSLLHTMNDGSTAEMGLTGNDGVVGVALFLGGETMPSRAVVQIAGGAFRMKVETLQGEFSRGGSLQKQLLRYTQALLIQISQTAVCNRLHAVEQRLCRWLLLSRDRVKTDEILMTQENIANMLGSRRESVTVAAGHLQDAGLIRYGRGHITIVNRPGLEAAVCECYGMVRKETDRLARAIAKR